jgi:hypothetical protein
MASETFSLMDKQVTHYGPSPIYTASHAIWLRGGANRHQVEMRVGLSQL